MAKLYRTILTEKKKKGDTSPVKVRPILLISYTVKSAEEDLREYWGRENYSWTRPNMISDFNPK